MKKLLNMVAGSVAAALLCVASVSPSCAQTTVFISGGGSDGNPCTPPQPCRSISHAVSVAAGNGGTVSCLDAGPYTGTFTTTLSFTLDCRGVVYALASYPIALTSNNSVVTFRHVIFDGAGGGGGSSAVEISGGKVVFEDCTFQNFTFGQGEAVLFTPTASAHLTITDSVFANNGIAGSGGGIIIQASAGVTASAVIERTQVTGNTYGIAASATSGGRALVEVRYSTIANSVYASGDGPR
jgi:hypothetical protein